MALVALSTIPALRKLNMDYNDLEMIPDEINRPGAFPRLEMLCVAGNCLSSLSLLPLSKVYWLPSLSTLVSGLSSSV